MTGSERSSRTWVEMPGHVRGYASRSVVRLLAQTFIDAWLMLGARLVNRDYPVNRLWCRAASWISGIRGWMPFLRRQRWLRIRCDECLEFRPL